MLGIKSNTNPLLLIKIIIVALVLFSLAIPISTRADSPATMYGYAAGDIQFCPKGKPYLNTSCEPVRTTMQAAINDALTAAAAGTSGTIYLEDGTYSNTTNDNTGGMISIQGFDYGTSLVIQGGVLGGTTTFVRQVYMHDNLGLDLSLENVSINTTST